MIREWFAPQELYRLLVSLEKYFWRFPYFHKSYCQKNRNIFVGYPRFIKNNTLVFGNTSDEKDLHPRSQKKFFINLSECFKQSLHLKNYSNSIFLCSKTKSPIFYCLKGKRKFVRINLLVEFFCLCVFFWNKKIYIFIHIRLMRTGR